MNLIRISYDLSHVIERNIIHSVMAVNIRKMFPILYLLCLVPGLPSLPRISQWRSAEDKKSVSAGSSVVLPCRVEERGAGVECDWVREGWLVELGGRFSVRDCDLVISPVLESDQAQYQCQVGGPRPLLSSPTTLTVNTEPSEPHIQSPDTVTMEKGKTLELTCQSTGGRPAAELEWRDEMTGERLVSEVSQHVERSGQTFTTTSVLRTPATQHMKVSCSAYSEAFPTLRQSSPVEVKIRGQPRLEEVQLSTGENLKIFCHNNIQDPNVQFKWFINDKLVPDENTDVLEINQFTESHDKSIVKCAAGNDEIIRAVQLKFNPNKKVESKIVTLDELMNREGRQDDIMLNDEQSEDDDEIGKYSKKKTTFVCVVEDDSDLSREPKYVWVNGKLVTNTKATDKDDRSYKCKLVKNGSRRIEKMSRDLKSVSKTLRKMSKALSEFSK